MATAITVQQMNKRVAVWSARRKQNLTIEVDYQRVQDGAFTLLHITRLQDLVGPKPPKPCTVLPFAA